MPLKAVINILRNAVENYLGKKKEQKKQLKMPLKMQKQFP